ncbi:hypothetical protein T06_6679, partial [Trichinella sp. T6]
LTRKSVPATPTRQRFCLGPRDPFFRNDVAEVRHPPLHKPAFLWFDLQTHFPEAAEHLAWSCRMFFGSLAKYDDIGQVHQAVGAHQASQECLNEPLKSS